eukprot:TRINITY_DN5423_c0_g1_i6.p1 TRINITY_DN5423_c0_g1~~TRINITY_DN5423_c0_g1_i6.p1  ORF type:complete len:802 (-),score=139.46 TRINITY_DN5423_c0_g1_i6:13-2394(-)
MVEKDDSKTFSSSQDVCVYTSVGCNRTCHCLVISKITNLMYYGANSSVAVYSPEQQKVLHTLVQLEKRVNCLALLENSKGACLLFAGDSSGALAVWSTASPDSAQDHGGLHTPLGVFPGHAGSLTCLSAVESNGTVILASTGNDSRVKIWKFDRNSEDKITLLNDLDLKSGLAFSVHLISWPEPYLTLFYSLDNCQVGVASFHAEKGEFSVLERLKGHEDWVTQVDTVELSEDTVLVATAGQDSIVRLWRLTPPGRKPVSQDSVETQDILIKYSALPEHVFSVQLESVLCGHEDKVNAVQWRMDKENKLSLLTASLDKTTIVWEEEEDGIWSEKARFGEIGGNTLGIFGAIWGPYNKSVIGYSFSGAFHFWTQTDDGSWKPGMVPGGHQGPVCDISWDRAGRYLLSVSVDQTTRCHAVCQSSGRWHEVARPQVHGYDMSCIAALPNLSFVSGAEEKVIRAFKAPQNFLDNFVRLTGYDVSDIDKSTLPQGASLPTLGLSNKAVYEGELNNQIPEGDRHVKDQFPDFYFSPEVLEKPPTEESLVQNTLWPEVHKLYGHGYEVYCVASSADGRMVASACKSSQPKEAAILIWDTKTWKEIGRIEVHSLTVTQLCFSPTADHLLSVSRDRSWALHKLTWDDSDLTISKIKYSDKKTSPHKRIIWTCAWSHDGSCFYTGSRDKLLACWSAHGDLISKKPFVLPDSVTAVAGITANISAGAAGESKQYHVAVGLDNGAVHILKHDTEGNFLTVHEFGREEGHHSTVTRLQFSPCDPHLLASASQDHAVKIYNLKSLMS